MEHEESDPSSRFRHMEPPIPLDQMVETVDVAEHTDLPDDGYRDQQWLIRAALG
ncbi:hypothetical protein [uncultured Microbacterium sp.]|uniref:hypothetical protein n=1 Tax=uncultured Microbacterium sp. TaxID=191216 RepID=UPI002625A4F6|nr:hypothetical protein [uncultured Microbacterium sp.]